MEGETFMGEEGMADVMSFKISAEILVFEAEQSDDREGGIFCGNEEEEP
jgi:hypothetical protein